MVLLLYLYHDSATLDEQFVLMQQLKCLVE